MFSSKFAARRTAAGWVLALSTTLVAAGPAGISSKAPAATSAGNALFGEKVYQCPLHLERILPAYYYSCRAVYYFQRHKGRLAVEKLKEGARWADKRAQYTLGLIYFNGDIDGIPADHALGLAWLAMAVERKNPDYMRSYAAALSRSTPSEQARAGRLWKQLNLEYSDKVVGPRAINTYNRALRELSDMSFGSVGGVTSEGYASGAANSAHTVSALDHMAETIFGGMQGTVTVGQPAEAKDGEPAAPIPAPAHRPAAPAR